MRKDFLEWLNSDNVIKIGSNLYVEQSSLYRIEMNLFRMYRFFIKEYYL